MTSSKYVVIQWGPDSTFLTSWGNFIHDGPETNNTARHSSNFSCGPSRVSFEVSQPTRVPLHVGVLIKAIGGTRKLNDSMIIAYPYFTILSYPIRSDPILLFFFFFKRCISLSSAWESVLRCIGRATKEKLMQF